MNLFSQLTAIELFQNILIIFFEEKGKLNNI